MHLGLGVRMPLVLRMRCLLVGRRGMGLGRGMRRRGMRGSVLPANRHHPQRQGSERGSQCCTAPSLRPGCALHVFPDLTFQKFRYSQVSNGAPGNLQFLFKSSSDGSVELVPEIDSS
jgi:hypothetical protein